MPIVFPPYQVAKLVSVHNFRTNSSVVNHKVCKRFSCLSTYARACGSPLVDQVQGLVQCPMFWWLGDKKVLSSSLPWIRFYSVRFLFKTTWVTLLCLCCLETKGCLCSRWWRNWQESRDTKWPTWTKMADLLQWDKGHVFRQLRNWWEGCNILWRICFCTIQYNKDWPFYNRSEFHLITLVKMLLRL